MRKTMTTTRRAGGALAALVLLAGGTAPAQSHEGEGILLKGHNYMAVLTSGQVTHDPLPASNASGLAFLTFDKKALTLCLSLTYSGLVGTETAAHIHGPAHPGAGNPNHIADLATLGSSSPRNGCVVLTKDQAKALGKNEAYFQVHTDTFPEGELRGQIVRIK